MSGHLDNSFNAKAKKLKRKSLAYALLLLCIISALWFLYPLYVDLMSITVEEKGQHGDQFGGLNTLFSGFAFAILIITLLMQREELELQRNSLDLQRDELHKIGMYNALSQISQMLDNFKASLPERGLPGGTNVWNLHSCFIKGMEGWKDIFESSNPQQVFDAYTKWVPIEGGCNAFLDCVISCVKIYNEATGKLQLKHYDDKATYVYVNGPWISKVPHLDQYAGVINALSNTMFLVTPGLKKILYSGLMATDELFPGTANQEELKKLKKEIDEIDKKRKQGES